MKRRKISKPWSLLLIALIYTLAIMVENLFICLSLFPGSGTDNNFVLLCEYSNDG